jgi:hypothetical protein
MKILKAKLSTPKKVVFKISDLAITQHGFKLQEIINGEQMINPIEVHKCTNEGTYGALGRPYKKGLLKVIKGSQRIGAAKELGYTHIEGVYV